GSRFRDGFEECIRICGYQQHHGPALLGFAPNGIAASDIRLGFFNEPFGDQAGDDLDAGSALKALRQGQDKSVRAIAGSAKNYKLRVGKLGHGNAPWHGRTRDHRGSATAASPAGEDRRGGAFALGAGSIRPRARHTRSVARSLQADKHPPAHNPKVRRTFTSNAPTGRAPREVQEPKPASIPTLRKGPRARSK